MHVLVHLCRPGSSLLLLLLLLLTLLLCTRLRLTQGLELLPLT